MRISDWSSDVALPIYARNVICGHVGAFANQGDVSEIRHDGGNALSDWIPAQPAQDHSRCRLASFGAEAEAGCDQIQILKLVDIALLERSALKGGYGPRHRLRDRKSGVEGKGVSVRVICGGGR